MKQIYIFFVIALTIISSYVQADIYSQYPTPDIIQCTRVSGIANQCLDDTRPQKHVVQYKDQYGQVTMQEEETYERLKCAKNQHKCTDSSGNYRGKTVISSDFFYIVYKDFYVYPGSDGADWAYKNGTGPLFGGAVSSAPAAVPATVKATPDEACSSKWIDAFHKENGEDAMITGDQLDEWDQWCAKGRLPN